MTKDDLCTRCGHRRELHREETFVDGALVPWAPGDEGPCHYLAPHKGGARCHGGDDGQPCPAFVGGP